MNKILGAYKNGNASVILLSDGTKIRHVPDGEEFFPSFPESIDVTITHRCKNGCAMCYAGCTADGMNGELLNAQWAKKLHPYTEMAIGGGCIFEHPDLIHFLTQLRDQKVVANITVHQSDFLKYYDDIRVLCNSGLVTGVGVSIFNVTEDLISHMNAIPNAVAHCILGITSINTIRAMGHHGMRILFLGYKTTGRGHDYINDPENFQSIISNIEDVADNLDQIKSMFNVVSFDNLALEQLSIRETMNSDEWGKFYMGDDGILGDATSATMFIDMVNHKYGVNSMTTVLYDIKWHNTVDDMFTNIIRSQYRFVECGKL